MVDVLVTLREQECLEFGVFRQHLRQIVGQKLEKWSVLHDDLVRNSVFWELSITLVPDMSNLTRYFNNGIAAFLNGISWNHISSIRDNIIIVGIDQGYEVLVNVHFTVNDISFFNF